MLRTILETARFLVNLRRRGQVDGIELTMVDVNGQPGAVARGPTGETISVWSLDIVDSQISSVEP